MPTGGISAGNLSEYLALPNCVGLWRELADSQCGDRER